MGGPDLVGFVRDRRPIRVVHDVEKFLAVNLDEEIVFRVRVEGRRGVWR
jgi:hypothetical protein